MIEVDELREVRHQVHRLAAAGVRDLSGAERCTVALEVRRLRELADHLEVHALGELDESGYTDATYGMPTAGWFARDAMLPSAVGRSQVHVARVLRRDLHGTDAAWLDGTINRDHVRILVDAANPRIRGHIAEVEDHLIGLVDGTTFRDWKLEIARVVARLDQDGPEPDDPTHTTASWSRSGAFAELRARLGGASVEQVEQILEAKTDELFRRHTRDRAHTPDIGLLTRNQLRGQALVELLIQALGIDTATSRSPRTAITLVVRANQVAGLRPLGRAAAAAVGWTAGTDITWSLSGPNGDHLLATHFESVLCDCDAHTLLIDDEGNPLNLGRTIRWATAKQRKAVLIRDGGCAFSGCDCPVGWLDIHHLVRWEDGGTTDISNLVALCRHHHGVAHRNGWTLTWHDNWLLWATPSGHTFWAQRHGRQRAGPAPPLPMAA